MGDGGGSGGNFGSEGGAIRVLSKEWAEKYPDLVLPSDLVCEGKGGKGDQITINEAIRLAAERFPDTGLLVNDGGDGGGGLNWPGGGGTNGG